MYNLILSELKKDFKEDKNLKNIKFEGGMFLIEDLEVATDFSAQ